MAEINYLDSVIQIDGENYSVTAEKVAHSLTIKAGQDVQVTFDGSTNQTIDVGDANYAETAKTAEKVANSLTIKSGTNEIVFDGSEKKEITIEAGSGGSSENANKIQVNMNDNQKAYATITIKSSDPEDGVDGVVGDIWFKY